MPQASRPAIQVSERLRQALRRGALPLAVFAAVTTVYIVYSVWQWNTFYIKSWDLSIFTQMYQGYAGGNLPVVAIKGEGFNLLGDHFHPLLIIFTPIFAMFPHPLTLLVIQDFCFGVAAGLVAWCAQRHIGPIAGVLSGLAFGMSWGIQYAVQAQFHEIALAVPLLTGALVAMLERRWWWAWGLAALLPFVKEDLGLTVVAVGGVMALLGPRRRGLMLALWGVVSFLLTVAVVLPALNPEGAWAYGQYIATEGLDGGNASGLWEPQKVLTVALIVAASAGFVFRSPFSLILLPTLAWRFLSSNESYWGPDWHYSAMLMPIAFIAAVDGISRAKRSTSTWESWWARLGPGLLAVACVFILLTKPTPLREMREPGLFEEDPRSPEINEILDMIPPGSIVESDIALMNYVVASNEVYWIGNANPAPEFVLVGQGGGTPEEWGDALGVAAARYPELNFELVANLNGYSLAQLRAE